MPYTTVDSTDNRPPDPLPLYFRYFDINLLSAPSGTGKTMLLAEWATRFRDGRSVCGLAVNRPAFIGVIATDRGWHDHELSYRAAGWSDIPHYSLCDDPGFNPWRIIGPPATCTKLFEDALDKLNPPPWSLIIVDTIATFLPGDLMTYKLTQAGLMALRAIARRRQLCIIGACHQGKAKNDEKQEYRRPQDCIFGSAALVAYSDTQLYLVGPESTKRTGYFALGMVAHHAPPIFYPLTQRPLKHDPSLLTFVPWHDEGQDDAERNGVYALLPATGEAIRKSELDLLAEQRFKIRSRETVWRHLKKLKDLGLVLSPEKGLWQRMLLEVPADAPVPLQRLDGSTAPSRVTPRTPM